MGYYIGIILSIQSGVCMQEKNNRIGRWVVLLIVFLLFHTVLSLGYSTWFDKNNFDTSIFVDDDVVSIGNNYSYVDIRNESVDAIRNIDETNEIVPMYTYSRTFDNSYTENEKDKRYPYLSPYSPTIAWSLTRHLDAGPYDPDNYEATNERFYQLDRAVANIKVVEESDFFKDKYFDDTISGEWLKTRNEVIIDRNSADKIFGKDVDPIGKTVYAHIGYVSNSFMNLSGYVDYSWMADMPDGIPVKIVGVSNEKYIRDTRVNYNSLAGHNKYDIEYDFGYYSIVSSDLMKQVVQSFDLNPIEYVTSYPLFDGVQVESQNVRLTNNNDIQLSDMINGALPQDDKYQVAISSQVMDSVSEKLGIIDYNKITLSSLHGVYSWILPLDSMNLSSDISAISISGVFEQNESIKNKSKFVFSQKIKDELYTTAVPNSLSVYLKDPTKASDFAKNLKSIMPSNIRYDVYSNYEFFKHTLIEEITSISLIFYIVSILLILVLLTILCFTLKLSSNSRQFDINILKQKGITRWRIFGIMLAELVAILILGWVLSLLPSMWIVQWLVSKSYIYKGIIFMPKFWHGLLAFVSLLAVGTLSILFFDRNSYKSYDNEHPSDPKAVESQ